MQHYVSISSGGSGGGSSSVSGSLPKHTTTITIVDMSQKTRARKHEPENTSQKTLHILFLSMRKSKQMSSLTFHIHETFCSYV